MIPLLSNLIPAIILFHPGFDAIGEGPEDRPSPRHGGWRRLPAPLQVPADRVAVDSQSLRDLPLAQPLSMQHYDVHAYLPGHHWATSPTESMTRFGWYTSQ